MIVGVPKETAPAERRVALIASSLGKLLESGVEVHVQSGAGRSSGSDDASYEAAGARIQPDANTLLDGADLLACVQPPSVGLCERMREGQVLVCVLQPYANLELVRRLAERGVTSLALDLMPRITRAQSMDILSAMSTVTGYESVLIAARALPKFFPMLMTAAGTIKPARVLVIGAGVAGLQAIATARRLGAVVEAFDVRAAAREQVESLGARFVEQESAEDAETAGGYAKEQTAEQLEAQRRLLGEHIAMSDVVITTALVPGKRAPLLVSAEQGGNCELTRAGEVAEVDGVQIHGPVNLASAMPVDASQMFARILGTYLRHLVKDGELALDFEDPLVADVVVTHQGAIVHEAVRSAVEG